MSLLRAAARPMLASYFIASGVKALRTPALFVDEAQPVADKLVPTVKKFAPAEISGRIPEDTKTLVRINGALQLGGGLALATGKGRRLGAALLAASLIPSTLARHPFWTRDTAAERAEDRTHFIKNVSLLGGVLLASADTEGAPSLAWRAQAGTERVAKKGKRANKKLQRKLGHNSGHLGKDLSKGAHGLVADLSKGAHEVSSNTQELAGAAAAAGLGVITEVAKQSRRSRKKARKQAKKTAARLADQAHHAQALAQKQAKKAAKKSKGVRKDVGKQASHAVAAAQEQAKAAQKQASSLAKDLGKDVSKRAEKVAENIHLGNN